MHAPLPEPRPTAGQRQPIPGWPLEPAPRPYQVELYGEADPIVHVPHPYNINEFVPVRRSQLQPMAAAPPRDLTPQPLLDPLAQRMLGAGVGGGALAAGVGYGAAQVISAAVGGITGIAVLVLLLLAARFSGPRQVINNNQYVTNHNRWWGHSSTNF